MSSTTRKRRQDKSLTNLAAAAEKIVVVADGVLQLGDAVKDAEQKLKAAETW